MPMQIVTSPTDGRHRVLDEEGFALAVFEPEQFAEAQEYANPPPAARPRRSGGRARRAEPERVDLFNQPPRAQPPQQVELAVEAEPQAPEYDVGNPAVRDPKVPHLHRSEAGWYVWNPKTRAYVGMPGGGAYPDRASAGARMREVMEAMMEKRIARHVGAVQDRQQVSFLAPAPPPPPPPGGLFSRGNGPAKAFGKRRGRWEEVLTPEKAMKTVRDARYFVSATDDWGRVVEFRPFEDRDDAIDYAHEAAMRLPAGNSMTSGHPGGHPRSAVLYTRAPGYASIADQYRILTFFNRTPTGVEERVSGRDVDGSPAVRRATRQPSNDLPQGSQRVFSFGNGGTFSNGRAHMVTVNTGLRTVSVPFPAQHVASIGPYPHPEVRAVMVTYHDGHREAYHDGERAKAQDSYDTVPMMLLHELYDDDYIADLEDRRIQYHKFKREARLRPETLDALAELTAWQVGAQYARESFRDEGDNLVRSLAGQWSHYMQGLPTVGDRAAFDRFVAAVRQRLAHGATERAQRAAQEEVRREEEREITRRDGELRRAAEPIIAAADKLTNRVGFKLRVYPLEAWKTVDPADSLFSRMNTGLTPDFGRGGPRQHTAPSGIVYEQVTVMEPVGSSTRHTYLLLAQMPGGDPAVLVHVPGGEFAKILDVARAFDYLNGAAPGSGLARSTAAPRPPPPARRAPVPVDGQRAFSFGNPPRYRGLTDAESEAVASYAASHGRNWRSDLRDDWTRGHAQGDLQRVRNDLGPSWLASRGASAYGTRSNGPAARTDRPPSLAHFRRA